MCGGFHQTGSHRDDIPVKVAHTSQKEQDQIKYTNPDVLGAEYICLNEAPTRQPANIWIQSFIEFKSGYVRRLTCKRRPVDWDHLFNNKHEYTRTIIVYFGSKCHSCSWIMQTSRYGMRLNIKAWDSQKFLWNPTTELRDGNCFHFYFAMLFHKDHE